MAKFLIEICANSVESALQAEKGGADRVELCDNLVEGGTTPSLGMIECAKRELQIPTNVIIRPRGGDFCYSESEFRMMLTDVEACRRVGVNGVVIGILTPDGNIDVPRCRALVEAARPMEVTFHRAFDMVSDPLAALEDVISTGAERLLTSGLQQTAPIGKELIADLVKKAAGRIIVMPGSGINEDNISEMLTATSAREYHMSLRKVVDGSMLFRPSHLTLSGTTSPGEFARSVTDADRVRKVRNFLDSQ